jgi:glycosyltransferase involved in cell wall biosynthesis
MKMCHAFAKNGHQVTLITHNKKKRVELGVRDDFAFYGVEANFEISKAQWLSIKGHAYLARAVAALRARGACADIVYGRALKDCFYAAALGLPVVYESHQAIERAGVKTGKVFARLLQSNRFLRLVVISEALRQYYVDAFPDLGNRIVVAPDAADPVDLSTVNEIKQLDGCLQVGYVGHLYPGKGMEVIAKLAPLCQWANFHVIGGTREDVEVWKQALRGVTNVTFHGFVPHSEAIRKSLCFDVMLAPYQEHVKGGSGKVNLAQWMSPLKIFEYMSLAKPIVSSDLPVLREVLQHGRNALLVSPNRVGEWAGALHRLRDAPTFRAKLGQNAREDFLNNYTWTKRAEVVLRGLRGNAESKLEA